MNTIPLIVYVVLTLYTRHHYRCQQYSSARMAISGRNDRAAVKTGITLSTSGSTSAEWRQTVRRLLLHFVPTTLLILTPAIEYGLVTDITGQSFFTTPGSLLCAAIGIGIHLLATRSAGRAVLELASVPSDCLVTTGEYARLRHPMSLSLITQGLGGGLFLGMHEGWIAWAVGSALLVVACRLEDRDLARRFPDAHAAWSRDVGVFHAV